MVLTANNFIACGGQKATLTTGDASVYAVKVRNRPEVEETISGFPYVVRRTGFLMDVPAGVVPNVGETVTFRGVNWKVGKVTHTPYCNHFGISVVVPSFLSGEQQTLKLHTVTHQFGCDAQENIDPDPQLVQVVILHNGSSELLENDALTFAQSWRLYVDNEVAITLDHDHYFEHQTNPNLFYRVQQVVDMGRLDRLPFALTELTS